jgi:hypothetical protein
MMEPVGMFVWRSDRWVVRISGRGVSAGALVSVAKQNGFTVRVLLGEQDHRFGRDNEWTISKASKNRAGVEKLAAEIFRDHVDTLDISELDATDLKKRAKDAITAAEVFYREFEAKR